MAGVPWFSKILALSVLASTAGISQAQQQASGPFDVQIEIMATCVATMPSGIDFGRIAPMTGTIDAPSTALTVQCTNGHTYKVELDQGANFDDTTRQMLNTSAGITIPYVLAQDASLTDPWVPAQQVSGTGAGIGDASFSRVHHIYAQATLQGDEVVGTYSDTVQATLTY